MNNESTNTATPMGVVNVKASPPVSTTNINDDETTSRSSLSMGIMILVLGSSAGMLFYTKRTGSMLRSVNTISEQQLHVINTNKFRTFGPATKQETEKMRPRMDKDEFF